MEVLWADDLMYEMKERKVKCMRVGCSAMEGEGSKFASCSRCGSKFCSHECLRIDWKEGNHKLVCSEIKKLGTVCLSTEMKRQVLADGVFSRIRMYSSPFFVHHKSVRGPGALFLQSPNPLEDFCFQPAVNRYGEAVDRIVFLAYVTAVEFDDDIVPADFEMALARAALHKAIESSHHDDSVLPALVKFRCGYLAVLLLPLVPDIGICRALASDYQDKSTIQLNVDAS